MEVVEKPRKMELENRYCVHDLSFFTCAPTNVQLMVLGYNEGDPGHLLGGNTEIHMMMLIKGDEKISN